MRGYLIERGSLAPHLLTCDPGEFVLGGPDYGAPFHVHGSARVGRDLEVGHIAEGSCPKEKESERNKEIKK